MHGDDQARLEHADHFDGTHRIERGAAAHRHQQHIDLAEVEFIDLALFGRLAQVAKMADRQPLYLKEEDDIALAWLVSLGAVIGR